MLYFSYAFMLDEEEDEAYASLLYLKGLDHGKAALFFNKDIANIWDKPFDEFAAGLDRLGQKDLPALVWTVANWSQFVSLHLDSTRVLVDIPRVTALLERAIELEPLMPEAYHDRAVLLERAGRTAEAVEDVTDLGFHK